MQSIALTVSKREKTENARHLRKAGDVPGVLYGNKTINTSIKCKAKEFHGVYQKAGENTLVEVELEGKKIPSLVHAVTYDPVKGSYEHIDLYAVDMTKKVTTHIPLVLEGESPAVKTLGAILVKVFDQLTVTCLPKDLPQSFIVDISGLKEFHDSITVAQIKVPQGVTIAEAPETVIITIQEPREEEVAPTPTAEGAVPAEGAAPAEGAPAAAGAAPAADAKAAAPAAKAEKKEAKK